MTNEDMRKHQRNLVVTEVTINDGSPYRGGKLYDMSVGGASVMYSNEISPTSDPIEIGQVLLLEFQGKTVMPARVARTFDGGFATKFDFSIPVAC